MENENTDCNRANQKNSLDESWSDLLCCQGIHLPEGALSEVYIGPCGLYALSEVCNDPDRLYHALRNRLGTPYVRLCVDSEGLWNPSASVLEPFSDEDELEASLLNWTLEGRPVLDPEDCHYLKQQLLRLDAHTRGSYVDEEGVHHVLRHGSFVPTSSVDPDMLYWLTLLGASLGLHRLYLGKLFSGFVYFLTAGLFGVGWLIDSISLLTGLQRDSKRRIVRTPPNRLKKLCMAPVGFFAAFFALFLYLRILHLLSSGFQTGLDALLEDPAVTNGLLRMLSGAGISE